MTRCTVCHHDYAVRGWRPLCHLCAYWRAYFGKGA